MANMQMNKTPMPEQEPNVRNANFQEVALGYTMEQAQNEAQRCLNCKNKPCVSGCPVGIPIPDFIAKVAEGDLAAAYQLLSDANALPAISAGCAPRRPSAKASVSVASRVSPCLSAASSGLWPTGLPPMASPMWPPHPRMDTRWRSLVPALPA